MMHIMVIGEIALGSIANRNAVLAELHKLSQLPPVPHSEVLAMIEWLKMHNCGVGFVDAHLLASVRSVPDAKVWTRDKRLHTQAERLSVAYNP